MNLNLIKIIVFLFLIVILFSCHNVDFDSNRWKQWSENNESEWNLRWDMSDDLINHLELIGKDTSQVFQLLGREGIYFHKNRYVVRYSLGPCRRGIDYGTLELTFINGKVCNIDRRCN